MIDEFMQEITELQDCKLRLEFAEKDKARISDALYDLQMEKYNRTSYYDRIQTYIEFIKSFHEGQTGMPEQLRIAARIYAQLSSPVEQIFFLQSLYGGYNRNMMHAVLTTVNKCKGR